MEADHTTNAAIMKDVLQLLRDIVPLLESVRHSIQESTKHIPDASAQLSKVSQATESATVEILDVIDGLSLELTKAQEEIQTLQHKLVTTRTDMLESISALKVQITDQRLLQHLQSIEEHFVCTSVDQFLANMFKLFDTTKQQYMSIAMALQVQDITNQQIVGVSHIIEKIYQHLATALKRFEHGVHDADINILEEPKPIVVDVNAEYTKSPERQLTADEIIRQWQETQGSL